MAPKGKKKKVRKNAELQGLRAANKPEYVTGTGQQMWRIHPETACNGRICDIHNPPQGLPESDWPTHWRSDRQLMERLCPHGIGHPSKSHMAYLFERDVQNGTNHANYEGIHGCDGCCGGNYSGEEIEVEREFELGEEFEPYFDDTSLLPNNGASDWEMGRSLEWNELLASLFDRVGVQEIPPPAIPWDPEWVDHNAPPNGIGPVCRYCGLLIDGDPEDHALDCFRFGNNDGLG